MVEVTDNALQELEAYFADKEISPLRIFLAPGGCSGPRLALALDGPTDNDATYDQGKFTFVMEKELFDQAQPLKVDISHMGFSIESNLDMTAFGGGGGCGCSSAGSCGSAGSGAGGCGTGDDSSGGCGCQ